jgi:hypothetical protein
LDIPSALPDGGIVSKAVEASAASRVGNQRSLIARDWQPGPNEFAHGNRAAEPIRYQ